MKKFLFDLFPLILFFVAYRFADIYVATAVAIAAAVLQILWIKLTRKPIETMHWINFAVIVFFGGATLWLQNEAFIKWKPTVLYAGMALGLAYAVWIARKNFLKILLGGQLELPESVWYRLNMAWVLYSAFMAAINAYVAHYYSTEDWVNFKLWGYAFPLVFIIGQGIFIAPHMKAASDKPNPDDDAANESKGGPTP